MTIAFESKITKADLFKVIKELERTEKLTKQQIKGAAYEVLFYACHKTPDLEPVNALVKVLTPANRSAVVQLVQQCTMFKWLGNKECKFEGLVKVETPEDKAKAEALRKACLEEFLTLFNGDIWKWYEERQAAKNETPPFVETSFERMVKNYAANNGNDFKGFDDIVKKAKEKAILELEIAPLIKAKVDFLVEQGGLSRADATKQANKMAESGALQKEAKAKAAKEAEEKAAKEAKAKAKPKAKPAEAETVPETVTA